MKKYLGVKLMEIENEILANSDVVKVIESSSEMQMISVNVVTGEWNFYGSDVNKLKTLGKKTDAFLEYETKKDNEVRKFCFEAANRLVFGQFIKYSELYTEAKKIYDHLNGHE